MMIKQKYILLLALSSILFGVVGFWAGTNYGSTMVNSEVIETISDRLEIGDSVEINGLDFRLNEVKLEPTDEEYGYIIADVSITNRKEQIHEFTLHKLTMVDEEGFAYKHDHHYETKGILGGQIAPGRTVRGEAAFLVPLNDSYEFIYTDHLRTGQVIWYVDYERIKMVNDEKD
ncbi:DUF4352 domain-containing protein [Alkalihalobacterium chitinilyticum]|uniref:DUF4352 domain-containing protein n=1 Tax=Alkalihalobacterium chitinilyticum TaxID=2980103 RepID=A0ABT5VBJ1_9BACI|nr:DUF4352 domain-containing protein [Alkalihalobacterium chitinilyticum]MDE5412821.1 DUF4352 domain-containing protein [Alkalihalobacterium chitinilyticum]